MNNDLLNFESIGEKIRYVRTFRNMTQKELGIAIGLGDNHQTRIAQYEMGFRVPKKETLDKMAEALDVCPYALSSMGEGVFTQIMEMLLWADTASPGTIRLATTKPNAKPYNSVQRFEIEYSDNDDWIPFRPTMMWFENGMMDSYLQEWALRKQELSEKLITQDEYTEWKLQWPFSCDNPDGKPQKPWRAKC